MAKDKKKKRKKTQKKKQADNMTADKTDKLAITDAEALRLEIVALQSQLATKMVNLWQSEFTAMASQPQLYQQFIEQMSFMQAMSQAMPPSTAKNEDETDHDSTATNQIGATPAFLKSAYGDEFHQHFATWLKEFQQSMEGMAKPKSE